MALTSFTPGPQRHPQLLQWLVPFPDFAIIFYVRYARYTYHIRAKNAYLKNKYASGSVCTYNRQYHWR